MQSFNNLRLQNELALNKTQLAYDDYHVNKKHVPLIYEKLSFSAKRVHVVEQKICKPPRCIQSLVWKCLQEMTLDFSKFLLIFFHHSCFLIQLIKCLICFNHIYFFVVTDHLFPTGLRYFVFQKLIRRTSSSSIDEHSVDLCNLCILIKHFLLCWLETIV